ncbi:TrlF family AAA-like ATPase [Burkholderia pseudomallei]|uniref:TrlF family AAA-like ATPase n=1 Tax=Burkholderia pseudomallei TaxID=28450 RepID=UPI0005E560D1|nr:AAA family ATPase [Burkholderia pseudomallei]CAJ9799738.1 hemin importer ATP-binding subunit [Burkholderia pseudomallei]CFT70254.1 hemin importer ATP-binding subunit [Burkholderia pseudomallei]
MNEKLQECIVQPNGARFYRGDLHIHSRLGSHDVTDSSMTPRAIVDTAVRENLQIIAVADHNEINNVQATVDAGAAAGVLVIPAVELSTPEGHLLCYFPTITALTQFHSRLDLADRGLSNSRCRNGMFACLDLAEQGGGFCILAHVDGGNGLETNYPGGSPHKVDILSHRALLGIELSIATSQVRYAPDDPDKTRAHIGKLRIERLGLGERQYLARILSSDSHTLNALGRNASQDRKLTRYKMVTPSFDGLRHALEEGDSRIRLEDEVPSATPFILGATIGGGFLRGQSIHFSPNLNCIIGGRGTGKSTAFEAIRCLTGIASGAEVIDSEVWPQSLHLFWQDEAGQQHSLSRAIGENITNLDDPLDGPLSFELDCFGQGEASRVREQAKSDPLALMKYLDTFTQVQSAIETERNVRDELINQRRKIVEAEKNVEAIAPTQRSLNTTQQKLKAFEAAKGSEVIKLQRSLATEKARRDLFEEEADDLEQEIGDYSLVEAAKSLCSIFDTPDIVTGREEAAEITAAAKRFRNYLDQTRDQIASEFDEFREKTKEIMSRWAAKEKPIRDDVEAKRSALEAQGVKLDMSVVAKLTKDEAAQQKTLATLKAWEPQLKTLRSHYTALLNERWRARKNVAALRQAYAISASRALAEVLTDLHVKLQYVESGYSDEAVSIIADAMNWRTVNYVKARLIVEKLTLPGLLNAIAKSKPAELEAITVTNDVHQFSASEAQEILQKLGDPQVRAALEQCHVDDLPRLTVTRRIDDDGKVKFIHRDFSQLSLGQQQSVLLALILSSDSARPLIIDQPEDNLDSEFIFHTFVPVLRRAKERRQVIIVTHNANIAVLGDAEQLIVFKSNSDRSMIVARGSIDDKAARDAACKILEGAREAFTRRARIYGIS